MTEGLDAPPAVRRAWGGAGPCLFLSAHLDDAVLSCGALITALAGRTPVVVATVFSAAGPGPYTRAARSFLRQCRVSDADELFAARRQEDAEALASVGAEHHHLGEVDALFRRREFGPAAGTRLVRLLPELAYRYPTYRFDIALGRVSRGDGSVLARATQDVLRLVAELRPAAVFAPLGVGRHVDHRLVRRIAERSLPGTVYYGDFPYLLEHPTEPEFRGRLRLRPWTWDGGLPAKPDLIRRYRTQAAALFPSGHIPAVAETYWTAAAEGDG